MPEPASTQSPPFAEAKAANLSALKQAQQHRIDSVSALVDANLTPDYRRVVLLTELARALKLKQVEDALPVLEEAVRLARQLERHDLVAETLLDLADYYISLANYGPAKRCLQDAQLEFELIRDLGGEVRCLGRLALVADQQGQYAASLAYCYKGMTMANTSETRRFQTSLKIQAGNTFTKLGDYKHAHEYLSDALRVARHYDYPDRINLALGGLGDVARRQKHWALARRFYLQSMAVSQRLGLAAEVLAMQLNLAEVDERQGNNANALALGYPVLRQSVAAGQLLAIPRALGLLARASLQMGRPDSAIYYGKRSLRASQAVRSKEGARAANEVLALAYAARKDFAQAYTASSGRKAYNDSLLNEATTNRTAALRLNYELGQQQNQIKVLTQQARLQAQQRELYRLRQQTQLIGIAGISLLAILVGGYFFWRFRRRQSARETELRARLAADLRDDVGTLLRQISLQSNLLQEGLADAAGQRLQINRLSDASRTAVRQLNDVVWSLDAQNDYLTDLLSRMRDYGHEVICPRNIELDFKLPNALPVYRLHARLRRNLYLIYKESLQNILKHAQAVSRVTVGVRLEGPQLILDIVDDGQPAAVGTHVALGRNGQGVTTIYNRATAIGGAATTGPVLAATGTVTGYGVRVVVPLPHLSA
ncbi:tetratricopeptide repeat-containing sensor histidine kinase [Hymenobacter sp. B1770]|uniref:tetratricopeptide repeat-containing sensor histidine kinase n=1 Tax=Hymenobacter sp. B1770 TaxID=1718788 RepID=UPI003CF1F9AE